MECISHDFPRILLLVVKVSLLVQTFAQPVSSSSLIKRVYNGFATQDNTFDAVSQLDIDAETTRHFNDLITRIRKTNDLIEEIDQRFDARVNNGRTPWRSEKEKYKIVPTFNKHDENEFVNNRRRTKKTKKEIWDIIIVLAIVGIILAIISVGICVLTKRSKQMAQAHRAMLEEQTVSRTHQRSQNTAYTLYGGSRNQNPSRSHRTNDYINSHTSSSNHPSISTPGQSTALRYGSPLRNGSQTNVPHSDMSNPPGTLSVERIPTVPGNGSFNDQQSFHRPPPSYVEALDDRDRESKSETPPPSYENCILLPGSNEEGQPLELNICDIHLNMTSNSAIVTDV